MRVNIQGENNCFSRETTALKRDDSKNRCLEMLPLFCDLVAKNNVTVSPMKTLVSAHSKTWKENILVY